METLHQWRRREKKKSLDTVRGFFVEGQALYSGAGFRELDHIQICVRSPKQIIGYFLPEMSVLGKHWKCRFDYSGAWPRAEIATVNKADFKPFLPHGVTLASSPPPAPPLPTPAAGPSG